MAVRRFEVYLLNLDRRLGRMDAATSRRVLEVLQEMFAP
jgi:hypothetical protein